MIPPTCRLFASADASMLAEARYQGDSSCIAMCFSSDVFCIELHAVHMKRTRYRQLLVRILRCLTIILRHRPMHHKQVLEEAQAVMPD